ncbi:BMP/retinoic acid-inducible neural-specific protein 3 [Liparis tanakae]|uniref:BMP/retinoic acid-inducible neural-specific protein 3 n=1 Tax=Liparis tanakae TaxID=230148 RepID=A0A4Z2IHD5_9TELE|nr:BMP/retinoic acid-inducible neural-specific protein 3 [Liparis tanakae]
MSPAISCARFQLVFFWTTRGKAKPNRYFSFSVWFRDDQSTPVPRQQINSSPERKATARGRYLTRVHVTETRTGPLGCSNYDSLDSVSSVLVHSPENKIHLKERHGGLVQHLSVNSCFIAVLWFPVMRAKEGV